MKKTFKYPEHWVVLTKGGNIVADFDEDNKRIIRYRIEPLKFTDGSTENISRKDLHFFIRDIMNEYEIELDDLMDYVSYNDDDVLDKIGEWRIKDYCDSNNITIDNDYYEEDEKDDDPESNLLSALKEYCSLKHRILDYDTVIEEVKELLQMHGYDKKLL